MNAFVKEKWRKYMRTSRIAAERRAVAIKHPRNDNHKLANAADARALDAFVELVCAIRP